MKRLAALQTISETTTHRRTPFNLAQNVISAMVLAGGGAGAAELCGAGAGGMLEISSLLLRSGEVLTCTVGAGGTPGANAPYSTGHLSQLLCLASSNEIAFAGAGGINNGSVNGGCGSGGSGINAPGGTSTQGNSLYGIGYGFGGGAGGGGTGVCSGGGGGTGGVGTAGVSTGSYDGHGGAGGAGRTNSITNVQYGGGGGGSGGRYGGSRGAGGAGGGGTGGGLYIQADAGAVNTGSGGGGSAAFGPYGGGAGGSGRIILKVPNGRYTGQVTGSPTIDTSTFVGFTLVTFLGTGTYTA